MHPLQLYYFCLLLKMMQVKSTYRGIWKVAMPIIIGSLAQNMINVTDTAFLGHVGVNTLGASAIAGIYYLLFVLLAFALAIGVQIIIARRTGENNIHKIGIVFDQGLYINFFASILFFLLLKFFSKPFIAAVIESEEIGSLALDFLNIRSYGVFFACLNMIFRALYIGLAKTAILTKTTFLMALVNVFLDYAFIFGKFGFPEMGIQGAALASVCAEFSALAYFLFYTLIYLNYRPMRMFRFPALSRKHIGRIFRLSYPTVFQNLAAIGSWFVFFAIIEKMGENELAVSNIVRSLMLFFMIPVWGLANTANTMTSNIIGQGKSGEVLGLDKRIMLMGLAFILIYMPLILIRPQLLIEIYTKDMILIQGAFLPLFVVYATMFVFVPAVIFLHSLSGAGDTRTTFIIEIAAIIIYLSFTYIVAIRLSLSLEYVWAAETLYWLAIGVLSYWRLKSARWKKIRV
jgi:putative MATE family efflux protein